MIFVPPKFFIISVSQWIKHHECRKWAFQTSTQPPPEVSQEKEEYLQPCRCFAVETPTGDTKDFLWDGRFLGGALVELPFSLFQKAHPKSPWKLIALLIWMCVVLVELTLPPTPKVSIWPSSDEWEQCRVSVSQICNRKQACFISPSSRFFWDNSVTSRLTVPALP